MFQQRWGFYLRGKFEVRSDLSDVERTVLEHSSENRFVPQSSKLGGKIDDLEGISEENSTQCMRSGMREEEQSSSYLDQATHLFFAHRSQLICGLGI